MAAITTHTETVVQLKPSQKTVLLKALRTYAELKAQMDALKSAMDKQKGLVEGVRAEVGAKTLKVEGFTVSRSEGVTHSDPTRYEMALIEMGNTAEMLKEAEERSQVPTRASTRITCPGSKEE